MNSGSGIGNAAVDEMFTIEPRACSHMYGTTAFDAFTWGTGGFAPVNPAAQPYIFTRIANRRETRTPLPVTSSAA